MNGPGLRSTGSGYRRGSSSGGGPGLAGPFLSALFAEVSSLARGYRSERQGERYIYSSGDSAAGICCSGKGTILRRPRGVGTALGASIQGRKSSTLYTSSERTANGALMGSCLFLT
ncbi:hypothetical protein IscW_ISCW004950 [Ixodes scapularis]|uniref:Uncharacterized protein n=1 Tax=Ixodes scapularis TaxID=6945 RepID=B7PJ81_IXOSC|nr:hypothetical protein IscW_ISCW004950 [Ixodes scapularis]|eukprot:XP_002407273.1 hypothetical protein IscW_ISCW004950 [Ixodes scapularis]